MQPKPRRTRQRKPQPGYDQALKDMLLAAHDAFLALIAPGMTTLKSADESTLKAVITAKSLEQVRTRLGLS